MQINDFEIRLDTEEVTISKINCVSMTLIAIRGIQTQQDLDKLKDQLSAFGDTMKASRLLDGTLELVIAIKSNPEKLERK